MNIQALIAAVEAYYSAPRIDGHAARSFGDSYLELAGEIRRGIEHDDSDVLKLLAIAPPGMSDAVETLRNALWAADYAAGSRMQPLPVPTLRFGKPGLPSADEQLAEFYRRQGQ